MSVVYKNLEDLLKAGFDFESKFVKKAQDFDAINKATAPLALKMIENLERELEGVYPETLKDLFTVVNSFARNKQKTSSDEFYAVFAEPGKAPSEVVNPSNYIIYGNYLVHKDIKNYLETLLTRARTEKNKYAELLLKKLVDEANSELKLDVSKDAILFDSLPETLNFLEQSNTMGNKSLLEKDLASIQSFKDYLAKNSFKFTGAPKVVTDNETVRLGMIVMWLDMRANRTENQAYKTATQKLFDALRDLQVPDASGSAQKLVDVLRQFQLPSQSLQQSSQQSQLQGQAPNASGNAQISEKPGDAVLAFYKDALKQNPIGKNELDLNVIKRFIQITQDQLDNSEFSSEFSARLAKDLNLPNIATDVKSQQTINEIRSQVSENISRALKEVNELLQFVNPVINETDFKGQDLVEHFIYYSLNNPNSVERVKNASQACGKLMALLPMIIQIETALIRSASFIQEQRDTSNKWMQLISQVKKFTRL